ncbi:MAG TPA: hypothetical protein VMR34_04740 [Candidatus Saccharimonadales bacterium]|nr:hypothetical protein [Candidatus Saccharimonadales bacterium]
MEKDWLLGGAVDTAIARSEQLTREPADITSKRAEIRAKFENLFHELEVRNTAVVNGVTGLTKPFKEVNYRGSLRKRLTVVMGRHEQTERTPDHVAICRVSYINNRPGDGHLYVDWGATAEFVFGVVPRQTVGLYIQHPQEVENPYRWKPRIWPVVETVSTQGITDKRQRAVLSSTSRLGRVALLADVEYAVNTAEMCLGFVEEAIANPELNPRLYYEGSDVPSFPLGS